MESIENFLNKIEDVGEELDDFEREIEDRRGRLVEIIGRVEEVASPDVDGGRYGESLRDRLGEMSSQIRESTARWRAEVEEQVEHTEFVSQFDRSVIVMVLGKVNCGKSTLGNFIAGLPFAEADENPYAGLSPRFQVHEVSGEGAGREVETRELENGFPTDGTECTSEIQEFTLGGLTWVDSPGLHSNNEPNGELAKKYVDAAELVIYMTSNDSPLRASDLEELEELVEAGKPSLIAVPKFDDTRRNVDPETQEVVEETIPGSEEDRRDQYEWIEEQVEKANLGEILRDRDYNFNSTRVAAKAVRERDAELFRQSGMAEFYEQLGEVLGNEAVELKKKNPKRNFNRLVETIWGGRATEDGALTLENLKANVASTLDFIEERRNELEELAPTIVNRTAGAVAPQIEARFHEAADRMGAEIGDPNLEDELTRIITDALENEFSSAVARSMRDVMKQVDRDLIDSGDWEIPSLEMITEEVEVSRAPAGKGVGNAVGGTAGGVAGMYFGGPVGAIVGTLAGGALAGWVGSNVAGTKTVETEVGTNVEEAVSETIEEMQTTLPSVVRENLQQVDQQYFHPLSVSFAQILDRLEKITEDLMALRYDID